MGKLVTALLLITLPSVITGMGMSGGHGGGMQQPVDTGHTGGMEQQQQQQQQEGGDPLDFTCVNTQPFYLPAFSVNFVGAGHGKMPLEYGRYKVTGPNQKGVPPGIKIAISSDIELREINHNPGKHGEGVRIGALSCISTFQNEKLVIPIFSHMQLGDVFPAAFVSQTVNAGDEVTLYIYTEVKDVKWRKGNKLIRPWTGKSSITIKNAQLSHSGIYEAFSDPAKAHAVMRLIVRPCKANLIGKDCKTPCFCYNGGVCHNSGRCICPPGFSGELCEVLNGPECFGRDCQYSCKDRSLKIAGFDKTCRGKLFCLLDPFGCTCSPGYMGLACDKACEQGTFGANCLQTCHCADGSSCDPLMGTCTPAACQPGWTGSNCNERITCRHKPCQNGASCEDVGINYDYKCICPALFSGKNCEIKVEVQINRCEPNPCLNQGLCVERGDSSYECFCRQGFDGRNCQEVFSTCTQTGTCQNNALMICKCAIGFEGRYCETNIDDCESDPCKNDGVCIDLVNDYRCDCADGFTGENCGINIDECELKPCQNGGACIDQINSYECDCADGFEGDNCEININECESKPCQNNGQCIDLINAYRCDCVPGFTGVNCAKNIDDCKSQPCQNNGVCKDKINAYLCECPDGFRGVNCEENIDECGPHPCQNGATCIDLINAYRCECAEHYEGVNCELLISPCRAKPCKNGATCIADGLQYSCTCAEGFRGPNCEHVIHPCEKSPCQNDGVCVYRGAGFACTCADGYTGKFCEIDIDECESHPCQNDGICQDRINAYICKCSDGFRGVNCEINIDDCKSQPCKNGAVCQDRINAYLCVCADGFRGVNCEENIDECKPHPCQNGGVCIDQINDYLCKCAVGFTGENCEINIDDCKSQPCQNNGVCHDKVNAYSCTCAVGFRGVNCEENIDDCEPHPCKNGGTCIDKVNAYVCTCVVGFTGEDCEKNVDDCKPNPCENGGVCKDRVNDYLCYCQDGYTGKDCEINIDECSPGPCQNGATCIDLVNAYRCTCVAGYAGKNCETNINECKSHPCKHGGTCRDLVNAYRCDCAAGWTDENCGTNIDECEPQPCKNGGTCKDLVNAYRCICAAGYSGKNCETNINECRSHPCKNRGHCKDLVNDYLCECAPGFTGKNCEININECKSHPCKNGGTCKDLVNAYRCDCAAGWTDENCATNIDECAPQPCKNGGTCKDLVNAYRCSCAAGYTGKNCETNINECKSHPCKHGGTCMDLVNAYRCICAAGWTDENCETNIDECAPQPCKNGGTCKDLVNAYRCICAAGYTGKNCETNINECRSHPCKNRGHCKDLVNAYLCECAPGFTGKNCEININECKSHPCKNGGTCKDLVNAYRCDCAAGWTDENCETNIDECAPQPCKNGGTCKDLVNAYRCSCAAGYTGKNCETNINECKSHPCKHGGTCMDLVNAYRCICAAGWTDENCATNIDECAPQPCKNGGTCKDLVNAYRCICAAGYTGKNCETNINECRSHPCKNRGHCKDLVNAYLCECAPGFTGKNCEININECESNPCQNGGVCHDEVNAYRCECPSPYIGVNCGSIKFCQCEAWGDPHHLTYDGREITFQGECEYVLSEHTLEQAKASGLDAFRLIGSYRRRRPTDRKTYIAFVRLEVNKQNFKLHNGLLFVNGKQALTPYHAYGVFVMLQTDGTFVLMTNFGLIVKFQGSSVSITLHGRYSAQLNGICGDCDDNKENDCKGYDPQSIGRCAKQWAVSEDCAVPRPFDGCLENPQNKKRAVEFCKIIIDAAGPFKACFDSFDLAMLYNLCLYDLCASGSLSITTVFCDHLENVATVCTKRGSDLGDWRAMTPGCPKTCPIGMKYNSCGSACPRTCGSEPSQMCATVCVEQCECPEGLLLSDGKCVPEKDCGCKLPDGGYLPSGKESYNDDCTKVCSCESGKLNCKDVHCHRSAQCMVKGGERRCYCKAGYEGNGLVCKPEAKCRCMVWGDPHYGTFDGVKYNFQGDCEYTLLKPCQVKDGPDFELIGNNLKNSPTHPYSYLRETRLVYNGKVYELLQAGKVTVSGEKARLPYSDANGVRMFKVGKNTLLSASFGLDLMWNNDHGLTITIKKSAFFDNTCGLCGTCNDVKHDEFLTRDAGLTSSTLDFGNSWKTGDRQCVDVEEELICPAGEKAEADAMAACHALIDNLGALGLCHDFVDPTPFYETCVYDMCAVGFSFSLCQNMEEYSKQCVAKGGAAHNWWRDRPECQPTCPENAYFIPNFPGCPYTCAQPKGDPNCPFETTDACICIHPLLLDGDKCVSTCGGCTMKNGAYLENHESFVNEDCSQTCSCNDGELVCTTMECSQYAQCRVRNGARGCICKAGFEGDGITCEETVCECTAYGSLHYNTFDGLMYDFNGDCEYVLVERFPRPADNGGPLENYRVVASNEKNHPFDPVSFTRSVRLEVNGQKFEIRSGGEVFINGIQECLPYTNDLLTIRRFFPKRIVIDTSFQLSMLFEPPHSVRIRVLHESHKGKTAGLCGTCNGNVKDELMLPNGKQAATGYAFANAWTTNARECIEDTGVPICKLNSKEQKAAIELCSVLASSVGPFAQCREFVKPDFISATCVLDGCSLQFKAEALCENLRVYAQQCRRAGGSPGEWWKKVPQCASICPVGMIYDPCGSACQETCDGMQSEVCNFQCEEVCRCPDGKVLSEDKCVDKSECGCTLPMGGYLEIGEEWYSEGCTKRCACSKEGLKCITYSCPDTSKCAVKNGLRKCYCPMQYTMKGDVCLHSNCVCNVYGDPHYSTFDKVSYDYQGDCEYILVQKCAESATLPDFKLIGRHSKAAPQDKLSKLRYLRLEYAGSTHEIFIGGKVRVNGRKVFLPYMDDKNGVIIGNQVFGYTTMFVSFGLFIMYDNSQKAEIHLNARHMGLTCGMCGTCSNSQEDEFKMPNGQIANTVEIFGASWRNDKTCETEGVTINPCVSGSEDESKGQNLCHLLKRLSGALGPCFDILTPTGFYDACVMDICVAGSAHVELSCSILSLYAQQCRQLGGEPRDWRLEAPHCGAAKAYCPEGAFLVPLGAGCQPTCDDPTGMKNCQVGMAIETCMCQMPLVLQDDKCIPLANCGCKTPGNDMMKIGDIYISDKCDRKCTCSKDGIKCVDYSCHEKALCQVRDGVRKCYCRENYEGDGQTCKGSGISGYCHGDPHCYTFSHRKFDYQGACEYNLVEVCGEGEQLDDFKIIGTFDKPMPRFRVTVVTEVRLLYKDSVFEFKGPFGSLVDGVRVELPFTKKGVIMKFIPKKKWTMSTDFGLEMSATYGYWMKTHYANVDFKLPAEFKGRTCGLLGSSETKDLILPSGKKTTSIVRFGDSWATGDRRCQPTKAVHPCPEGTHEREKAVKKCYVIIDKFGPLAGCQDFMSPTQSYNDCVYDICLTDFDLEHLCRNIDGYVDLCRKRSGRPGKWWKYVPECAAPCPADMEYTDCGSSCQPTCEDPKGPKGKCADDCVETCLCPKGQVLDGEKCVFPYNCGCKLPNGVYISQGETYTYEDCSQRCTCENGDETCKPLGCRGGQECRVVGEKRDCFCKKGFKWDGKRCTTAPCKCTVWGDPHYLTFDGKKYDFQGDCEYTLIETYQQGSLPAFRLIGDNKKNKPSDRVSYIRRLKLEYKGTTYEVLSTGVLKVNGLAETLPFTTGGRESVTILSMPPSRVFISTHFGLKAFFSYKRSGLLIDVSPRYHDKLRGMCGTCNRNRNDDFLIIENGITSQAANVPQFGNAWVAGGTGQCENDSGIDPCPADSPERAKAEELCFILKSDGPFVTCRAYVDSSSFYETCVYDVCVTQDMEQFCSNLKEYAEACRDEGGDPGKWWNSVKECPAPCPADMIYTPKSKGCPKTCARRDNPIKCDLEGLEACVCPDGKVLDGNRCVYPRECGCDTPDGTYISPGAVYINKDCSERCTCTLGFLQCEDYQCHAHSTCQIRSGERDCYCAPGYVGDGHQCKEAECECWLWNGLNVRTFDTMLFSHDVACQYVLMKKSGEVEGLPAVQLTAQYDGQIVTSLRLEVDGVAYELNNNGVLSKDGTSIARSFMDDKIALTNLVDGSSILTTTFGVSIYFKQGRLTSVKLANSWRGHTTGLCGNCNMNEKDDFTTAGGRVVKVARVFANSWRLDEGCRGIPTVYPEDKRAAARDRCFELMNPNGIFADCHDFIPPDLHFETCILDVCGNPDRVSDNFAAYAAQCRSAGKKLGNWRIHFAYFAPLCPENVPYKACASACLPSCTDLAQKKHCLHNCIETCQCPFGTVSNNNGQCVKPSSCGCYIEGYGILHWGMTHIDLHCTQFCKSDGISLTCKSISCDKNAFCGEKDGVFGCHCNDDYEGDGYTCKKIVTVQGQDCYEIYMKGLKENGVYTILPKGYPGEPFSVYCDMTTDGGGWTVFQRRNDLKVNFYRNWADYKNGFGDPNGEYWLGNEALHYITSQGRYQLRIDMVPVGLGQRYYALYGLITVGPEEDGYELHWEKQSGSVIVNALLPHDKMEFTTFDQDNDRMLTGNCAKKLKGGWWYNNCAFANLNGMTRETFTWMPFTLQSSEMKIKPTGEVSTGGSVGLKISGTGTQTVTAGGVKTVHGTTTSGGGQWTTHFKFGRPSPPKIETQSFHISFGHRGHHGPRGPFFHHGPRGPIGFHGPHGGIPIHGPHRGPHGPGFGRGHGHGGHW